MKLIVDFFVENYVLLTILVGLAVLTVFDVFLDKKVLIRLRITLIMLFSLAVFDYIEMQLGNMDASVMVVKLRILFSALCYSLRPLIVMMLVFIADRRAHWLITIPATLNILVSFSAFFTNIAYTIKPDNHFSRGILGFIPHIISIIYVILLFIMSFRGLAKRSVEEGLIVMFLAIAASLVGLLVSLNLDVAVNDTYGVAILLYYLYLYAQYTKRDALTGLLNRQSYYNAIEKHPDSISGIISIDMNELKWINDTLGHQAGDEALKTIAACFLNPASAKDYVYRVGGDEFIVLCRDRSAEDMRKLVDNMRDAVKEAGYSCAFGLSIDQSVEDMLKESDALMYQDKRRIKEEITANGGILHTRKI